MIDEKKLISDIEEFPFIHGRYDHKNANTDFILGVESMYEMVIEKIEEQPKIGEWIPCSERLPEEKINPVTDDFYEYQVTYKSDSVTDVRHYKFGRGHWWNGGGTVDEYVIAWRERPEAYKGEVK